MQATDEANLEAAFRLLTSHPLPQTNHPVPLPDGCGWVKPISVAEEDRLTTTTKRTLLAHNELYEEFCRDD